MDRGRIYKEIFYEYPLTWWRDLWIQKMLLYQSMAKAQKSAQSKSATKWLAPNVGIKPTREGSREVKACSHCLLPFEI